MAFQLRVGLPVSYLHSGFVTISWPIFLSIDLWYY